MPRPAKLPADVALPQTSPRTLDRETFGRRLRAARKKRGWTLAELAERSRVSVPTISRVERGLLALSYEKFSALGTALGLDMGAMFSAGESAPVGLDRPVLTRAGEGVTYRGQSFSYEFLGTQAVGKQMSPILGTVHARRIEGADDFARHDGEEFIYVLSGAIDVHFASGERIRLARGDSLYFDSRIGHAYISVSRRPARTIGACTTESAALRRARERTAPAVQVAARSGRSR